ncbi:WUSCHEL-related homeobox 9-like isoform X3 [Lotus japonicus]|uniref:WUSCHEL-related homeobox 9-like isoform X3 n=1 Tax=Lotus japonicus TaxID=34305 RepID=UPI00258F941B|nr:WUSCHEL-related homeobox 9-like isoform X3 [Lotus japonicus]
MAASNKSWPSMFKSKRNPNHQWHHDINSSLLSTGFQRTPYASGAGGGDERTPEPRPRWNPKPEQICILEAIFNSGMVNPPRDEIRKIRMQLQEYGQVGDANVFYWFQNRKSRSKHKLRNQQNSKKNNNNQEPQKINQTVPNSSSSSSSEKSTPKEVTVTPSVGFFSNVIDVVPNSPTPSVNQTLFQTNFQLPPVADPFSFAMNQEVVVHNVMETQGFHFTELSNIIQPPPSQYEQNLGQWLTTTNNIMSFETTKKDQDNFMTMMHQPQHNFSLTPAPTFAPPSTNTLVSVPSPITQLQVDGGGTAKCTVFINDVAVEVAVGPINVPEAFGEEAMLIHSSGIPVLTDEWGFTLHPLQHGASYYLI